MISKFFNLKTHFGRGDDPTSAAGGTGEPSRDEFGGGGGEGPQFGGTLTADLGGGLTAQVDPGTGRTVSFAGGAPQESLETLDRRERALKGGRSEFAQSLLDKFKSPRALGTLGGSLFGLITGAGPVTFAKAGGDIVESLFTPEPAPGQQPPGQARQQEIQQAQQQAGLTSGAAPTATSPLSLGPPGLGIDGGEDRAAQAVQIAAAGRQSGLQPQLGQQPPQLPQQRFLDTQGAIPTVNIGAFPGALGRV